MDGNPSSGFAPRVVVFLWELICWAICHDVDVASNLRKLLKAQLMMLAIGVHVEKWIRHLV